MSSPTFPVDGTAPVTIFRRQQEQAAYNLYNLSATTDIYVDDSPQTPGVPAGVPLHPGAQLTWESSRECYAICATGSSATLLTSPAAGGYFDPYTLALNILTLAPAGQNLAQQIAGALYISGVPPVDNPARIINATAVNVTGSQTYSSGIVSCAAYQSAQFLITETGGTTPGAINRTWTISFFQDAAGTNLQAVYQIRQPVNTLIARGTIPVQAPYISVTATATSSPTAGTDTVTVQVYGSYRTVSQPRIQVKSATTAASALTLADNNDGDSGSSIYVTSALATATSASAYPSYFFGPGILSYNGSIPGATAGSTLGLYTLGTGVPFYLVTFPAAFNSSGQIPIYLNGQGFELRLRNNSGTAISTNFYVAIESGGGYVP